LSKAVHQVEPEGYIRIFLDEGAPMEALLSQLQKHEPKHGSAIYLETLLTAFQQESRKRAHMETQLLRR
jgi:hypothetical protein